MVKLQKRQPINAPFTQTTEGRNKPQGQTTRLAFQRNLRNLFPLPTVNNTADHTNTLDDEDSSSSSDANTELLVSANSAAGQNLHNPKALAILGVTSIEVFEMSTNASSDHSDRDMVLATSSNKKEDVEQWLKLTAEDAVQHHPAVVANTPTNAPVSAPVNAAPAAVPVATPVVAPVTVPVTTQVSAPTNTADTAPTSSAVSGNTTGETDKDCKRCKGLTDEQLKKARMVNDGDDVQRKFGIANVVKDVPCLQGGEGDLPPPSDSDKERSLEWE